jgi:hypothetical protein
MRSHRDGETGSRVGTDGRLLGCASQLSLPQRVTLVDARVDGSAEPAYYLPPSPLRADRSPAPPRREVRWGSRFTRST